MEGGPEKSHEHPSPNVASSDMLNDPNDGHCGDSVVDGENVKMEVMENTIADCSNEVSPDAAKSSQIVTTGPPRTSSPSYNMTSIIVRLKHPMAGDRFGPHISTAWMDSFASQYLEHVKTGWDVQNVMGKQPDSSLDALAHSFGKKNDADFHACVLQFRVQLYNEFRYRVLKSVRQRCAAAEELRSVPRCMLALALRLQLLRAAILAAMPASQVLHSARQCVYGALEGTVRRQWGGAVGAEDLRDSVTPLLHGSVAALCSAELVHTLWLQLCEAKKQQLIALTRAGDRMTSQPADERLDECLTSVDWRVIDLMLVHSRIRSCDLIVLDQLESLRALTTLVLTVLAVCPPVRYTIRAARVPHWARILETYLRTGRTVSVMVLQHRWLHLWTLAAESLRTDPKHGHPSHDLEHPLIQLITTELNVLSSAAYGNSFAWTQVQPERNFELVSEEEVFQLLKQTKINPVKLDFTQLEDIESVAGLKEFIRTKLLKNHKNCDTNRNNSNSDCHKVEISLNRYPMETELNLDTDRNVPNSDCHKVEISLDRSPMETELNFDTNRNDPNSDSHKIEISLDRYPMETELNLDSNRNDPNSDCHKVGISLDRFPMETEFNLDRNKNDPNSDKFEISLNRSPMETEFNLDRNKNDPNSDKFEISLDRSPMETEFDSVKNGANSVDANGKVESNSNVDDDGQRDGELLSVVVKPERELMEISEERLVLPDSVECYRPYCEFDTLSDDRNLRFEPTTNVFNETPIETSSDEDFETKKTNQLLKYVVLNFKINKTTKDFDKIIKHKVLNKIRVENTKNTLKKDDSSTESEDEFHRKTNRRKTFNSTDTEDEIDYTKRVRRKTSKANRNTNGAKEFSTITSVKEIKSDVGKEVLIKERIAAMSRSATESESEFEDIKAILRDPLRPELNGVSEKLLKKKRNQVSLLKCKPAVLKLRKCDAPKTKRRVKLQASKGIRPQPFSLRPTAGHGSLLTSLRSKGISKGKTKVLTQKDDPGKERSKKEMKINTAARSRFSSDVLANEIGRLEKLIERLVPEKYAVDTLINSIVIAHNEYWADKDKLTDKQIKDKSDSNDNPTPKHQKVVCSPQNTALAKPLIKVVKPPNGNVNMVVTSGLRPTDISKVVKTPVTLKRLKLRDTRHGNTKKNRPVIPMKEVSEFTVLDNVRKTKDDDLDYVLSRTIIKKSSDKIFEIEHTRPFLVSPDEGTKMPVIQEVCSLADRTKKIDKDSIPVAKRKENENVCVLDERKKSAVVSKPTLDNNVCLVDETKKSIEDSIPAFAVITSLIDQSKKKFNRRKKMHLNDLKTGDEAPVLRKSDDEMLRSDKDKLADTQNYFTVFSNTDTEESDWKRVRIQRKTVKVLRISSNSSNLLTPIVPDTSNQSTSPRLVDLLSQKPRQQTATVIPVRPQGTLKPALLYVPVSDRKDQAADSETGTLSAPAWVDPDQPKVPSVLLMHQRTTLAEFSATARASATLLRLDSSRPLFTIASNYVIVTEKFLPCKFASYWTLEKRNRFIELQEDHICGPECDRESEAYEKRLKRRVSSRESSGVIDLTDADKVKPGPDVVRRFGRHFRKLSGDSPKYAVILTVVSSIEQCDQLFRERARMFLLPCLHGCLYPLTVHELDSSSLFHNFNPQLKSPQTPIQPQMTQTQQAPSNTSTVFDLTKYTRISLRVRKGVNSMSELDLNNYSKTAFLIQHHDARLINDLASKIDAFKATNPDCKQLYVLAHSGKTLCHIL